MFDCYLDANATTFMPDIVVKSMLKWFNKGNASSHYATESRDLINLIKHTVLQDNQLFNHTAIITSGASESNAHIITSTVCSFMKKTNHLPHVIVSSLEHKSVILTLENLKYYGLCQYSIINPRLDKEKYGMIDPNVLEKLIKSNTCLITIMTANNETGIMNDIPALVSVAHRYNIPFHSDCVQSFGKYGLYPGVDSCSISFHKLHGPPGLGMLIIKDTFLKGYDIKGLIGGTQEGGLRGGTENIPAIGGSYAAYRYTNINRNEKNNYLFNLKNLFKSTISKYFNCYNILEYSNDNTEPAIFFIENLNEKFMLPNTILMAVYKYDFCNVKMREMLEKNGIIISIGSACNTSSDKASDVVKNLQIPYDLYSGVFRISFDDNTKKECIFKFVEIFKKLFNESKQG